MRKTNKEYMQKFKKNNPNYEKERYQKDKFKILVRAETKYYFKKDWRCHICKSEKDLEWHHLVYSRPVMKEHLLTLCKTCHELVHSGEKLI